MRSLSHFYIQRSSSESCAHQSQPIADATEDERNDLVSLIFLSLMLLHVAPSANSQHSCKYCRLLRCVRAGLQAPGKKIAKIPPPTVLSTLWHIVSATTHFFSLGYFPLGFSSHCPPNSGGTFWEMVYRRNYLYVERLRTMTAIGIDPVSALLRAMDCDMRIGVR